MTKINHSSSFDYTIHPSQQSLDEEGKQLVAAATEALQQSYAPYSKFHVACALRLSNGEIVTGSNQENSAYPSGLCAERVAIFAAMHRFPKETIAALAITASSETVDTSQPIMPCGSCRQVMLEYELNQRSPMRLLLAGNVGKVVEIAAAKSLLPLHFFEEGLKA